LPIKTPHYQFVEAQEQPELVVDMKEKGSAHEEKGDADKKRGETSNRKGSRNRKKEGGRLGTLVLLRGSRGEKTGREKKRGKKSGSQGSTPYGAKVSKSLGVSETQKKCTLRTITPQGRRRKGKTTNKGR